MHNVWLNVEYPHNKSIKVFLTEEHTKSEHKTFRVWRISPLHPVEPDKFEIPTTGKYFLGFFVHPQAFCAIGSLTVETRKHLLYGIGLASVVVCCSFSERKILTDLVKKWRGNVRAFEIWEINGQTRKSHKLQLGHSEAVRPDFFKLPYSKITDPDVKWLGLELDLNLRRFIELSSQYAPSNLSRCNLWAKSLSEILVEIRFMEEIASGQNPTPPASLSGREIELLRTDNFFLKKKLNGNIDRLIQVNSSLVYATSQAFFGCVPVHISLPMVSQHSLLGVGTAWFAVRNLCSFIEQTFEQFSVPKIIQAQFGMLGWRNHDVNASTRKFDFKTEALDANGKDPVRPKIPFFSSRLGFGESDFTVTCAMQCLHAASSPRYGLMTLSHELMHAHVKQLLLSIFLTDILAIILAGF